LNKEDAVDHCKWRKVIKEARWSGWVWVGECFFWYRPTRVVLDQMPLNGRCCCCCCLKCHERGCMYVHFALASIMAGNIDWWLVWLSGVRWVWWIHRWSHGRLCLFTSLSITWSASTHDQATCQCTQDVTKWYVDSQFVINRYLQLWFQ